MTPKLVLLSPLMSDTHMIGGVELGFASEPSHGTQPLLDRIQEPLGVALQSAFYEPTKTTSWRRPKN